jgi:hypothetical protein
MRPSASPRHSYTDQPLTRWSRVGVAGFTFFLLKGLLWLLAPVLFALVR